MPGLDDAVAKAALDFLGRVGREELAGLDLEQRRALVDDVWAQVKAASELDGAPFSCRGAGCWGCCRGEVVVGASELADLLPRLGPEVFVRWVDLFGALVAEASVRESA